MFDAGGRLPAGSVIWAGSQAPTEGIGNDGDYYLNTSTGEYHGPKDGDAWGDPIIVLIGNDGKDGADGEDGSRIYAGAGEGRQGHPDPELGQTGDFYLNTSTYNLYGPKTPKGWGSPINIKGAQGNANVTRYIYSDIDFGRSSALSQAVFSVTSLNEMEQSAWLAYLIRIENNPGGPRTYYYSLPGYGFNAITEYGFYLSFNAEFNQMRFNIVRDDGPGEAYDRVELVRIEASSTEDLREIRAGESIIPNHLDTYDYEAVAEYYGF